MTTSQTHGTESADPPGRPAPPPQARLARWDRQQQVYIQDRARSLEVMLEFVGHFLGDRFTALDLACGPGSVSARLLRRFPDARCVALDADPVLLAVGQHELGDQDGRLHWVRADLRAADWTEALPFAEFDVVLSSTATHWLRPAHLAALYEAVAGLLRPGGVLLNSDQLKLPHHLSRIRAAITAIDERRQGEALAAGAPSWQAWWEQVTAEPSLRAAVEERERAFPTQILPEGHTTPTLAFHESALHEAGFGEVAVIWQDLDHRLLLALR